jgi:hypothetical protein
MKTVTDKAGKVWRVDAVIVGGAARAAQISPGHGQINISPPGATTSNHMGIQLPELLLTHWLDGLVRVAVINRG